MLAIISCRVKVIANFHGMLTQPALVQSSMYGFFHLIHSAPLRGRIFIPIL